MKRALPLLVLALLVGSPSFAAETEEATKYFEAGKQAYDSGQYLPAAAAFAEAYRLAPHPALLFSLAQAHRRQYLVDHDPQNVGRAIELYRRYLKEVDKGGRRDDAVAQLQDLEPLAERLGVKADAPAPTEKPKEAESPPPRAITELMISSRTKGVFAAIDGEALSEGPIVREVAAGSHRVRAEAPGYYPQDLEAVAIEGRFIVVEVNLIEKPAKLFVRAEDGSSLYLDGRPLTPRSDDAPIELAPGGYFFAATRTGHEPFTQKLQLARGETRALDATHMEETDQRKVSYALFGVTGALAIAAGVTTVLAFHAQSNAEDILAVHDLHATPLQDAAIDDYAGSKRARDGFAAASWVLASAALVSAVTAAVLFFFDAPSPEAP
jgi:hypothetical protein